jgi:hypothetical protein
LDKYTVLRVVVERCRLRVDVSAARPGCGPAWPRSRAILRGPAEAMFEGDLFTASRLTGGRWPSGERAQVFPALYHRFRRNESDAHRSLTEKTFQRVLDEANKELARRLPPANAPPR